MQAKNFEESNLFLTVTLPQAELQIKMAKVDQGSTLVLKEPV